MDWPKFLWDSLWHAVAGAVVALLPVLIGCPIGIGIYVAFAVGVAREQGQWHNSDTRALNLQDRTLDVAGFVVGGAATEGLCAFF